MGMEARIINELIRPGAYPRKPASVELIQTHISYLFLTPELVYKIKKPVDFGFLDFTTLEKRRHFCVEEVRLNRRLAPRVYLGVVEVRETRRGLVFEGDEGEVVEYAVKMRRLAPDKILEEKIRRGDVTEDEITRVARTIAAFHAGAEQGPRISAFGAPEVIEKNISENFSQTEGFVGDLLGEAAFDEIRAHAEGFLREERDLLLRRVEEGFIRDCHGDIHSEHISINREIEIIDCIEFNERFRYSDTISDAAFLSMDLDFHNRADLGRVFEEAYTKATGDRGGMVLMAFYKSYRAYVRGKVEGFKAREQEVDKDQRRGARLRAMRYFDLSRVYASGRTSPGPRLIIVCGPSGTGKSTLASALGRILWAQPLSTDRIRREMEGAGDAGDRGGAPGAPAERPGYGEARYTLEARERTYAEMVRRAAEELRSGRTVILDATFSKNRFLAMVLEAARRAGLGEKEMIVFECSLDRAALLERVRRREEQGPAPGTPLSEMRSDIIKKHLLEYEKKEGDIIRLDTAREEGELLGEMMRAITGMET
jgi:hypothetical protein